MMRPLPIAACVALAFAAHAPAATAQQVTGNAETGRGLTYTCVGCHGIEGYKNAYRTTTCRRSAASRPST